MQLSGSLPYLLRCFASAVFIALVLAGCAQAEFRSEFSGSGNATHTLGVTFPRDEYERLINNGFGPRLDEIIATSNEAGLRVERVLTSDTVTVLVSTTVDDSRDVGAALNSLLNASGISTPDRISTAFAGEFRQETPPAGGTQFVLDVTVDGQELYDSLAASASPPESRQELIQALDIRYVADLPGDIKDSTADRVSGGVAEWEIEPTGPVRVYAESQTGGLGATVVFIIAGMVAAVIVITLAVFVGRLLIRRPGLSERLAYAAAYFPRQTTINRAGIWVTRHMRGIICRLWSRSGPGGPPPLDDEALEIEEGVLDGADTEGDRPVAGVRRR